MKKMYFFSGPDKAQGKKKKKKKLWCHGFLCIKTLFNFRRSIGNIYSRILDVQNIRWPRNEYEQGLSVRNWILLYILYLDLDLLWTKCCPPLGSVGILGDNSCFTSKSINTCIFHTFIYICFSLSLLPSLSPTLQSRLNLVLYTSEYKLYYTQRNINLNLKSFDFFLYFSYLFMFILYLT